MTTRQLFTTLFVISLFILALTEAVDPDMWWHLRTGEAILRDGIPRHDIFSFTVPDHPWVTHEWLSQVVIWQLYRVVGFSGLIFFFAAVITLTFWLTFQSSAGRPYIAGFITLLAALAASLVWGVRPQMFNTLFLALFVFIIERYKRQPADAPTRHRPERTLLLLPLLTIVWANLHSGYLLGVVLLATYTVGEALDQWFGTSIAIGRDWKRVRWLGVATVSSLLAALLNANGYQLWIYPFLTLGSDVMQSQIHEWHSPDFHESFTWPFGLLIIVGVISWAVAPKRPSWADLLLFLGTMASGLVSLRHIPIFAVVAAPIIARNFQSAAQEIRLPKWLRTEQAPPLSPRISTILNSTLLVLFVALLAVRWTYVTQRTDELVLERYPAAAVDFLQREGLAAQRGFNSYNWGGYLIWREIPVFVDGRADVYGDDFLREYFNAFSLSTGWREILDEYDIEYVLVERAGRLAVVMEASNDWREVYQDEVARVFVREPSTEAVP